MGPKTRQVVKYERRALGQARGGGPWDAGAREPILRAEYRGRVTEINNTSKGGEGCKAAGPARCWPGRDGPWDPINGRGAGPGAKHERRPWDQALPTRVGQRRCSEMPSRSCWGVYAQYDGGEEGRRRTQITLLFPRSFEFRTTRKVFLSLFQSPGWGVAALRNGASWG